MLFTDQLGNAIQLNDFPKRIISLVPSQTELLIDLGLAENIVGVTRFCIHPHEAVKKIETVGGTKNFDIQKISFIKPDLIIGNKEENEENGIHQLQQRFPVWISDIVDFNSALDMILAIGDLTNTTARANEIATKIQHSFSSIENIFGQKSVAYFIWRKPYMIASNNTFINALLEKVGLINTFAQLERYPMLSLEELTNFSPDFVFLSSEPYSFSERHFNEFEQIFPKAKIVVVDGELFSWYGSRLLLTPNYLQSLQKQLAN